ncbi:hypothetical protein [Gemmatimonas phototrophica]|uniref:Spore coat protein U domain-containing protein n=1 Tax=Gemmatimonas phototrophica TaxID=1379270 RepID=A0A143BIJ9_9BACT|nr:hypothetical protein [Gemmatimonas phototrophica]AMW04839.1 hypothetical protein GEMMAAP_08325 [Gemmatimonas phototrophica]
MHPAATRLLVFGCFLLPALAEAQSISCTVLAKESERTCSATFEPLARIPVTAQMEAPSASYALAPANGIITADDFARGFAVPASPLTLTWRTNANIRIYVRSATATLTGGCNNKPASSVTVGTTTSTATDALPSTGTGQLLFTQASPTGGGAGTVHFRVGLNWASDAPAATCLLPLIFTVEPY